MIYDALENHLLLAGGVDRAAIPAGMFFAWSANLGLLSEDFLAQHELLVLRLRYREIKGSELFVVAAAGVLKSEMYSAAGQSFCESYYPQYMQEYQNIFGTDVYAVEDSWDNYDLLAAVLTRHYLGPAAAAAGAQNSGSRLGEKRWWQIWR